MKKLVFIAVFIMVAVTVFGQLPKTIIRPVNANLITADTTYTILTGDYHYGWCMVVTWANNDGTTSTVQPVVRQASTDTWITYANISAYTITGASGSVIFEDADLWSMYLGLKATVQSGKTMRLTVRIIPTLKK